MKKLLLSLIVLSAFNAKAQITLFEDSFEFYDDFAIANVGDWTLTDVDLLPTYGFQGTTFANTGVPKSFIVFNANTTTPPITTVSTAQDWTARTGERHMVCFASTPTNNDWLISPQIELGVGNTISFWAKACNAQYGAERFTVNVSTTDTAPASFTKISAGNFIVTPNITWIQYTYTLPASYDSTPVYVGIRCLSPDMFGFAVDDFTVTATALGTQNFFSQNYAVYPNPADSVLNITGKNNVEVTSAQITDLNGRVVKTVNGAVSQINIADLTAGVYFLKLNSAQGAGTTKIVKK